MFILQKVQLLAYIVCVLLVGCALASVKLPQLQPGDSVVYREANTVQELYSKPLPQKQEGYYLSQVQNSRTDKFQLIIGRYGQEQNSALDAFDSEDVVAATRRMMQEKATMIADFSQSFGDFETVIGIDGRKRVEDTTQFPFSAIAQISYRCTPESLGQAYCTGTMIKRYTMLTAGHCVTHVTNVGIASCSLSQYTISPGFYKNKEGEQAPFGSYTPLKVVTNPNWNRDQADWKWSDYALIIFEEPVGSSTGWFRVGINCFNTSYDKMVTAGYPYDKHSTVPELIYEGDQMVTTTCKVKLDACANEYNDGEFEHQCDTAGGQSGSPMWIFVNSTDTQPTAREIRGVHVRGIGENIEGLTEDEIEKRYNKGVYISVDAFRWIQANAV